MPHDLTALILPGLGDSGPEHWQSHWERRDSSFRRLVQTEWDAPNCADWVSCLDAALLGVTEPVVLVAHSSSCAMVAHWAVQSVPAHYARVKGALLVAPSDPAGPHYPPEPQGFAPVPLVRLPFPTVVVASTDDPYLSMARARDYAAAWGSQLIELHGAGHINAAAGFGPWPEGWESLQTLLAAPPVDASLPFWLATEKALDAFLVSFRAGTFPLAWWTHGAHVAMAAAVLWEMPVPHALATVRADIQRYNLSQGRQNNATSGYHETLTRLWLGVVAAEMSSLPESCPRLDGVRRLYHTFARRAGMFRDWYPYDVMKSTEARAKWVRPEGEVALLFGAE